MMKKFKLIFVFLKFCVEYYNLRIYFFLIYLWWILYVYYNYVYLEQGWQFKFFVVYFMKYGDMDQKERDVIMREFRIGFSRVLIIIDLLVRGIDV